MMLQSTFTDVNYDAIADSIARKLKLPESLIAYVLLERLYQQNVSESLNYFCHSALSLFLQKMKGSFEIKPSISQLYLQFDDGDTLSASNADITWPELFELAYIHCNPQQLSRIHAALDHEGIA
jgi:hypothetical protein